MSSDGKCNLVRIIMLYYFPIIFSSRLLWIAILFSLFSLRIFSKTLEPRLWVGGLAYFPGGWEITEAELEADGKILVASLSQSKEGTLREYRYLGKLIEKNGETRFQPESCGEYGTKAIGERWTLILTYDCEHLEYSWKETPGKLEISPSLSGFPGIIPMELVPGGKFSLIRIPDQKEGWGYWGLSMKKMKEYNLKTEAAKPGERIQISIPKKGGLFD
jgi:hypothetical protein